MNPETKWQQVYRSLIAIALLAIAGNALGFWAAGAWVRKMVTQ